MFCALCKRLQKVVDKKKGEDLLLDLLPCIVL